MEYTERFIQWKDDVFFDEATRNELSSIEDESEIEDRFFKDLDFGTGGLRGVMGAGTNRINRYTIGKVTVGLGNYLLDTYGAEACKMKGVVIGYDTRNNSEYFSRTVADILSGMGVLVYLYTFARPTPELSFSVKYLKALAGVVITASHNSKEYNGYKIYDRYGVQIVPEQAEQVIKYINAITDYHSIKFSGNPDLINKIDLTNNFVAAVLKQSRFFNEEAKANLHIIYTPLHGTGNIPVQEALKTDGFTHLNIVADQMTYDGNFPSVVLPNPEERCALEMGILQAQETNADIILGTDPDCDRVGTAVKTFDGYKLITGNQMGALLIDFILKHTNINNLKNPAVVKTVVTSELGVEIAKKNGLTVFSTLTGFKFIGEKITQFEHAKEENDENKEYTFVFGYEESYGYLVGTHCSDKDAVVASLLICEMAAYWKKQGKTLFDRLNEIFTEFGYYLDDLTSFAMKGKDGAKKISTIMDKLRCGKGVPKETVQIIDYSVPVKENFDFLPTSNVIKFILQDGSWVAVRPSGTEPKIKIYFSIKAFDKKSAEDKLLAVKKEILLNLGLK